MSSNVILPLFHLLEGRYVVTTFSQSINQPATQPSKQSTNQSTNQSINQPINEPINQSINQPTNQSANLTINQPSNQVINQSTNQEATMNQSVNERQSCTLYKCWDFNDHRWVVIKMIETMGKSLDRALHELNMLKLIANTKSINQSMDKSINQPINQSINQLSDTEGHLIKLKDCFTVYNRPCFVFDYLPINLRDVISSQIATLSEFADIISYLLNALVMLHDHFGIVHNDIRPASIMMSKTNGITVKVIDFASSFKEGSEHQQAAQDMVSLWYRSPEALLGLPIDRKTDVWSLGCTLAEMWTGRPLFDGDDELETLHLHEQIFGPMKQEIIATSNKGYHIMNDTTGKWQLRALPEGNLPRSSLRRRLTVPWDYGTGCFDQIVDLLSKMLQMDPKDRAQAAQLTGHPFMIACKKAAAAAQPNQPRKLVSADSEDSEKLNARVSASRPRATVDQTSTVTTAAPACGVKDKSVKRSSVKQRVSVNSAR